MNLLNHPVVGSLVHHKWKKYGFALYITNLFVFVSFLVLLTTFALIVPNPKSEDCKMSFPPYNNYSINVRFSYTYAYIHACVQVF